MGIAADIAAFKAKLDLAIDDTMQGPVLDEAKKFLRAAVYSEVYGAYSPEFYSRRMDGGGLADIFYMRHNYGDKTLQVMDMTPWQQLYGGARPGERLAEAIASGNSRYHFNRAGARPFHEEAEHEFASSGRFEDMLASGLRAHGFAIL